MWNLKTMTVNPTKARVPINSKSILLYLLPTGLKRAKKYGESQGLLRREHILEVTSQFCEKKI